MLLLQYAVAVITHLWIPTSSALTAMKIFAPRKTTLALLRTLHLAVPVILLPLSLHAAHLVRIEGTVVNQARQPIENARIALGTKDLQDTTDTEGRFLLRYHNRTRPNASPKARNGAVPSSAPPFKQVSTRLRILDLRGRQLGGFPAARPLLEPIWPGSQHQRAGMVYLRDEKDGSTRSSIRAALGLTQMTQATDASAPALQPAALARSRTTPVALHLVLEGRDSVSTSVKVSNRSRNLAIVLDVLPVEIPAVALAELGRGPRQVGHGRAEYPRKLGRYLGWREAWCSEFVSWVYKVAGYPLTEGEEGGWLHRSSFALKRWFARNSRFVERTDPYWDSADPSPGDYIRYNNNWGGHSGLVRSVSGTTLHTIEGNINNQVVVRTIHNWRDRTDIDGFGLRSSAGPHVRVLSR